MKSIPLPKDLHNNVQTQDSTGIFEVALDLMQDYTFIGIVAAICTTISFVPQALVIIKTKQTRDISLGMYSIFSFGIFLWLTYGILSRDIPLIAANSVTFVLSFTILVLKIKYK